MGKGKRKRERKARREGLAETTRDREKAAKRAMEERREIGAAAVANGPRAKPSPTALALDPRREEIEAAEMQAWRDAGEP